MERYAFIVIGAGVAGVSVAAQLARQASVLLIETEDTPGRHATGRSAAMLIGAYGGPEVAAVTRASRPFFAAPGDPWPSTGLLSPRGRLVVTASRKPEALERHAAQLRLCGVCYERLSGRAVRRRSPLLRADRPWRGLWIPETEEIDVDALLQGYLKVFRAGGRLLTDTQVTGLSRSGDEWSVTTSGGVFAAATVVDAAGAWAGRIGALAGAADPGLLPLRRTVVLVDAEPGDDTAAWPQVVEVGQRWYFKPDSGRILVSPVDETPSEPQDAQPDEIDVAIAVDRFERATRRRVMRVSHRWAGLRTFAKDRLPVVGFDLQAANFFWMAGQGGAGIMMAPALANAAAKLLLRPGGLDELTAAALLQPFNPGRFQQ